MRSSIQIALFLFIAAAVRAAETINAYASVHWREFATQNYFDRRGVFASKATDVGSVITAPELPLGALSHGAGCSARRPSDSSGSASRDFRR